MTDTWADTDIHWEGDSWNDTGTNLYGCLKQLNLLKKQNRNLKVLLSIGGWTYSSNFKAPASTHDGREKFAKSSVELVKHLGFDGIDIDWEYPQDDNEAHHYVELLAACRRELDLYAGTLSSHPHFEMSVACPAGPQNYEKLRLKEMDKHLDFWNLMAYDYAGSWDTQAGHQANIYKSRGQPLATPFSTEKAIEHYIKSGVDSTKLVLGMPLYGRAFENTDGVGKPYQGIGDGTWERGVYDYKQLPLPGANEDNDNDVVASYSYDPSKRMLVSYDTPDIAQRKGDFISAQRLGGAMWWESSGDAEGERSLVRIMVERLGGPTRLLQKENCLDYPHSKYDNLRGGFQSN